MSTRNSVTVLRSQADISRERRVGELMLPRDDEESDHHKSMADCHRIMVSKLIHAVFQAEVLYGCNNPVQSFIPALELVCLFLALDSVVPADAH